MVQSISVCKCVPRSFRTRRKYNLGRGCRYDFYTLRTPSDGGGGMAGVDFDKLAAQPTSSGLWEYTKAEETYDVTQWHAGTWTGLLSANSKFPFKKSVDQKSFFDGTDDFPASNWGETHRAPCLSVNFARDEGSREGCADAKDMTFMGIEATPRTLGWSRKHHGA